MHYNNLKLGFGTDDEEDFPAANELVASCTRNCMRRDDDGCLECMENCSGIIVTVTKLFMAIFIADCKYVCIQL